MRFTSVYQNAEQFVRFWKRRANTYETKI